MWKWMELEIILLRKISQMQTNTMCFLLPLESWRGKTEVKVELLGCGNEEKGRRSEGEMDGCPGTKHSEHSHGRSMMESNVCTMAGDKIDQLTRMPSQAKANRLDTAVLRATLSLR